MPVRVVADVISFLEIAPHVSIAAFRCPCGHRRLPLPVTFFKNSHTKAQVVSSSPNKHENVSLNMAAVSSSVGVHHRLASAGQVPSTTVDRGRVSLAPEAVPE